MATDARVINFREQYAQWQARRVDMGFVEEKTYEQYLEWRLQNTINLCLENDPLEKAPVPSKSNASADNSRLAQISISTGKAIENSEPAPETPRLSEKRLRPNADGTFMFTGAPDTVSLLARVSELEALLRMIVDYRRTDTIIIDRIFKVMPEIFEEYQAQWKREQEATDARTD